MNSIPSTVGGGGTHADGKVPRFREDDFRLFSALGPQPDAEVADWPLAYDDLEPYYAEVERSIGVAGTAGANPFAAWRSGPYPMPPGAPMYGATLSSAAAERLGFHPYHGPDGRQLRALRRPPGLQQLRVLRVLRLPDPRQGRSRWPCCSGRWRRAGPSCGPRPSSRGSSTTGRRATGVDFIGPDGVERSMDARHVVVAGGAIETPRLLLLSGIEHRLVGRYLMVHFQTIVVGLLPFRLHGHRGRAVTHVHDDAVIGDDLSRAAAKEAGLPWIRGGMVEHGGAGTARSWRPGSTRGATSPRRS